MREIGGYIELDRFTGNMLYDDGIKLNCGRNALEYLIITKDIRKMFVPKFMCNSNDEVLKKHDIEVKYFSIGLDFKPVLENRNDDEWLYLVNYYGQLSNEYIQTLGKNVIVDNAQAYFQEPIEGYDTAYACRKFFGVSDGSILFTDRIIDNLPQDESHSRMGFLLGRFERPANEFYQEYVNNNERFFDEPLKRMSKLTENLLHAIDYKFVKNRRTENFEYLHRKLKTVNKLDLTIPEGAFMYPLYIDNGDAVRRKLQSIKIYIPTLWPDVFNLCETGELEYDMAKNILPLPVDQRYGIEDMEYIVNSIIEVMI